jgi:hypothetical protein
VHRVLKPGGIFAGPEFGLSETDPFLDTVRMTHAWTNNESLSVAWYKSDIAASARAAGFSKVSITPFAPLQPKDPTDDRANYWRHYVFEK